MSLIVKDRVVETSTSTGTGDFTLAGAVTGYQRFGAVMSLGDSCYYLIEAVDLAGKPTGDWETGYGFYNSADTLTRSTIQASSNGGSAVNFAAGPKRVSISVTAAQIATITGGVVGSDTSPVGAASVGGPSNRRYWRLYCTATQGNSNLTVMEVQFRDAVGVASLAAGGTALGSAGYFGNSPTLAFDNNTSTAWSSNNAPSVGSPAYIGYDYGAGVTKIVRQVMITISAATQGPSNFSIQYSDDGTTWVDEWSVAGAVWTDNATLTFTSPNANTVASTQQRYPKKLAALNDVDVSTAPTDGQALTYNAAASKWKPASGSGGISDAPSDGTLYGRKNGSWSAVTGGSSGGALTLLEKHTAAGSADLQFTTAFSSTYDVYLIEVEGVVPATDAVALYWQASTNGGSTWDASGIYAWAGNYTNSAGTAANPAGGETDTKAWFFGTVSNNAAACGVNATAKFYHPSSSTKHKQMHAEGAVYVNDLRYYRFCSMGSYRSTTPVNALRFYFASGNIAAGTIRIYGVQN